MNCQEQQHESYITMIVDVTCILKKTVLMHTKRKGETLEDGEDEFLSQGLLVIVPDKTMMRNPDPFMMFNQLSEHIYPENVFPTFLVFGSITVYY